MNKEQLVDFYRVLQTLGELRGAKFAFAINKNISMLKPEVEAIGKGIDSIDGYLKYQEERIVLAKEYSKKNGNGEAMTKIQGGQEVFDIENGIEFNKKLAELKEAHKKANDEYDAFLKEEISLIFHKVKIEDVPNDITGAQMELISEMIVE